MVALWMLPNFYPEFGLIWFDPPPFELLQLTLSIIALPMRSFDQAKPARKTGEQRAAGYN